MRTASDLGNIVSDIKATCNLSVLLLIGLRRTNQIYEQLKACVLQVTTSVTGSTVPAADKDGGSYGEVTGSTRYHASKCTRIGLLILFEFRALADELVEAATWKQKT